MGSLDLIPSQIAGTPIASSLPLGVFGTGYVGHEAGGPVVLKVLGAGELLDDLAAFNRDAATLAFEESGEDMGQPVLRLSASRLAVTGCLVGGSRLQDAAIRAGELLDPDQELARRLRSTDASYRVKLLLNLAKGLEATHSSGRCLTAITPWNLVLDDDRLKLIDAGIVFDPTSEDFDGEMVHPDIRIYLAPEVEKALLAGSSIPASEAADVYGFAATARSLLQNRLLRREQGRLVLEEGESYSEEIESLLVRCLATDPGRRPSMSELRTELERRSGDVEWRPTATWPAVAATGMAIVLLLATVLLFFKPEDQATTAQQAFVAAAKLADLESRDEALDEAWILVKGRRQLIPPARRLRAVHDYLRWSQGSREFEVNRLLTRLEDEVVVDYDDELASTMRVILGALRRWELETEDDVQHGTHLLEAPIPASLAGLAVLAEAGRTIDPATSSGTPQSGWLDGIEAAAATGGAEASEQGALVRPLGYAAGAAPVGLDSAWVADLVRGRLLTRLGRANESIESLAKAHKILDSFSTRAALGLALAETGADPARARSLLSSALDGREDFVELQLALARAALDDAHLSGDLAAFSQAAAAYTSVRSVAGGNQELFLAAKAGAFEAKFYAALLRTNSRDSLPKAKTDLEALVKELRQEAALQRRYLADVRLALGVVLTRLGKARDAQGYLLEMFEGREIQKGWATLPELKPLPKTRDRRLVVRALLSQAIPQLEELRRLAVKSPSEARASERDVRAQLTALLELEEAGALGAFRMSMLKAEVQLTRGVVSRSPGPKLEAARLAYAAVRDSVRPDAAPGDWIEAQRGIVSVYQAMQRTAKTGAEKVTPLLGAADDLATLDAGPDVLKAKARTVRDDLAKLADDKALEAGIDALIAERKAAWNGIDVERPRYTSPSAGVELRALRRVIAAMGPAAKLSTSARLKAGIYYGHLTRIGSAVGSDEFVKDGRAGLSILAGAASSPKTPVLMRHLNLILGCAALRAPEVVKGQLEGIEPWTFAKDALARACGADDYKTLRAAALKGSFKSKRRAAALLADGLLDATAVPRSEAAGVAIPESKRLAEEIAVALALNPRSAKGHLLRALVRFSTAGTDAAKLKRVAGGAKVALGLALEDDAALETRVQSARLLCYATFLAKGEAGLGSPALKSAAEAGTRAAGLLFQQQPSQRDVAANCGPAYWVARIGLAAGDAGAGRAYDAYAAAKGSRKGPPEAAGWEAERAKAKR